MKRLTMSRFTWSLLLVPSLAFAAAQGCSSNSSSSTGSKFDVDSGGGGKDHDGSTDGSKHHPDDATSLNGDSSPTNGGDACAGTSATAKVLPLDMYIVLDRSGSMADNDSWNQEVLALRSFVSDGQSIGIGVGLQYLPLLDLCNPAAYAKPAVPIKTLGPDSVTAGIFTSLAASRPFGGTPTVPALEGAIMQAKERQKNFPDREIVIVLSTDGLPDTSCTYPDDGSIPNNEDDVVKILTKASSAVPPIKTFVIGIGNEPALNKFAAAGGTGQAILVGAGDAGTAVDIEQPLIAALAAIRTNALPCAYTIPEMSGINYNDVNVSFTPGGGKRQQLYGVSDLAACKTDSPDWYYDNNANPQHIELCPAACTEVKASTDGNLSVAYGCQTLAPPK